ncbi:MAG: hypothetical protein CVU90_15730 [Firmicutes bacterium HGW-Firmicutes-15]|nr:MAG: hypothetical protein CVU90_15730 [Firmicutes bacterium HGW-Firmicutes-15]
MAGKRNLGMGLDLLLTAAATSIESNSEHQAYPQGDGNKVQSREEAVRNSVIASMAQAIDEDERGNIFEAYHLYRLVIDQLKQSRLGNQPELCAIISQALNNAAVILCEYGKSESAAAYLSQAVKLQPSNQVAKENLQALEQY